MKKFVYLFAIIIIVIFSFFLSRKDRETRMIEANDEEFENVQNIQTASPPISAPILPAAPPAATPPPVATKSAPAVSIAPPNQKSDQIHHFVMEDGVAVVQGDMVVGEIAGAPSQGNVMLPKVYPWKRSEIPFGIAADVQNPERIQQAVELFNETAIKLVPYDGQEDAIVFIPGTGHCKSYVGRVRGRQPIWIAPDCSPVDIAHEVMHALGFVHEQNRTDRDSYVEVVDANIKDEFKFNFEKLPSDFMQLSGLTDFDYNSVMMYPAMAFSKNNQPTIVTKNPNQQIAPSLKLSEKDIERINKEYGHK